MNDKYKINDNRDISSFKKETFSGFKKCDIINAVIKSIEAKKNRASLFLDIRINYIWIFCYTMG